jgi:predicted amidohydrolase YtcJ
VRAVPRRSGGGAPSSHTPSPRWGEGWGEGSNLALLNAQVITFDPHCPHADSVLIRGGRLAICGTQQQVRSYLDASIEVIDLHGAVVTPAFHDAHLHLLSYARQRSRLDCRSVRSIPGLQRILAQRAAELPAGGWVRAIGYDEAVLAERRHPDRLDLDAAVPDRPVRLQHRSLHLDVLNTTAMRETRLWEVAHPSVERDPATNEPTGRLFNAAELLRGRLPRPSFEELAADVGQASQQLLTWGVTSIQDATVTNGPEEWALFARLVEEGHLAQRVFMFAGARHWPELTEKSAANGRVCLGPVKLMVDETVADLAELREIAQAATAAGRSVAIHATSEVEMVMALELLRGCAHPTGVPHRIEHGSVIPDELLPELRALGVAVVGQPALVYLRGDVYRAEYSAEQHGWLHRARSLIQADIPYAIGSDAPVADPIPGLALFAARQRLTQEGHLLGKAERLDANDAIQALTLGPAQMIGAAQDLGHLRPGAVADLVILDPELFSADSSELACKPVQMTILEGRIVWERDGAERQGFDAGAAL